MAASIPASAIVDVTPSVLAAGGTGLDLNGLLLTNSQRVPVGVALPFASADAVSDYFGPTSAEYAAAQVYFLGFDNSNKKPGALLFAQYPAAPVQAYLRGGRVSGLTLAQLQAITGVLNVTIDGVLKTIASVNIAAATSFSSAAKILDTAMAITGPTDAVVTASVALTTMTVTAVTSGAILVGDVLSGGTMAAGTRVLAQLTGTTGGVGTYTVDTSQTVASASITAKKPGIGYDSLAGAFFVNSGTTGAASTITIGSGSAAAALGLTAAVGAVLSQGAIAGVPGTNMQAIAAQTQNWAGFSTLFLPTNADAVLFAEWVNSKDNRFFYAMQDTAAPATIIPDTTSKGALVKAENLSGVVPIYEPSELYQAVMLLGFVASIDFEQQNGRTTMAFRSQSGMAAGVTDEQVAANLLANDYNFYGAYATANDQFVFFYNGQISGDFLWIDSYVDQVWLNNQLQLALMVLMTSAGSIPYNAAGYAQIEAACADPINAALNFGAIRAGVTMSASQIAQVNADAGQRISDTLQTRGWYLQIQDATPQVRAARGSPPCTLWYLDGQSVQSINLASVEVQ